MGEDHDRLDRIFEEFRKTKSAEKDKVKALFHDFKTGLTRHIVWEEEILFPVFENKTAMQGLGPTAVMRTEHRRIKELLEKMHERIIKGGADNLHQLENELLDVLVAHNDKEENILYPWIDNSVSDKEKEEMLTKMRNLPPEKYSQCCNE